MCHTFAIVVVASVVVSIIVFVPAVLVVRLLLIVGLSPPVIIIVPRPCIHHTAWAQTAECFIHVACIAGTACADRQMGP